MYQQLNLINFSPSIPASNQLFSQESKVLTFKKDVNLGDESNILIKGICEAPIIDDNESIKLDQSMISTKSLSKSLKMPKFSFKSKKPPQDNLRLT